MTRFAMALLFAVLLVSCAAPSPGASAPGQGGGPGQNVADIDGTRLQVFTYRPTGCTLTGVLLVFHGVDRNAGSYRDDAIPVAQRHCLFVAAPLFDAERFPSWRYQRGGIVHGSLQPPASWTVGMVSKLAEWARGDAGQPDLPYSLIGHSAGAQFLSRVAAYAPGNARRIVIANPSTWVVPSMDVAAPYGFGGMEGAAEAALRRYLALPVTVLLGEEDTGSRNLATGEEADEQGATRIARGQNVFRIAEQTAHANGWAFGWHLAVVPGTGHNARAMLSSKAAFAALDL